MAKYDLIGDVRGQGLMVAMECVADRSTKAPADKAVMADLFEATYADGVMVRVSGPNIILSPPLVITQGDVQDILSGLETGFKAVQVH